MWSDLRLGLDLSFKIRFKVVVRLRAWFWAWVRNIMFIKFQGSIIKPKNFRVENVGIK